ncbi:MAG TPA: cation-translocating P-type ATPase [Catalimonadaceae bacterium]|nr:cation-translocating P-type ATPase [Catalimonadaceae bacterium]
MNPPTEYSGLTQSEAAKLLIKVGPNTLFSAKKRNPFAIGFEVLTEPMLLLLMAAASLYFVLGQWNEGWMLVFAILIVASISFLQNLKSDNALVALGKMSSPKIKVKRDGQFVVLPVEEIVPGDLVNLEEGMNIPADGEVVSSNDLSINESQLTGESVPVAKEAGSGIFAGTLIATGSLYFKATLTGHQTEIGKLGKSLVSIEKEKTYLQSQIDRFVTQMAWIGVGAFLVILGVNYFQSYNFIAALLQGLTIAMAMIPEEIPVAFASFMALGAVRLATMNVLAREPQTVESLGSATVICTDKTGTLTTEGMSVSHLVTPQENQAFPVTTSPSEAISELLLYARLASEPEPFDAMEKAISDLYGQVSGEDFDWNLVQEYPLEGKPPMMTHVYRNPADQLFVAAKGGMERILAVCLIPEVEAEKIRKVSLELSSQGYRILGVAKAAIPSDGNFPESQDDFKWTYLGLVALLNPPKPNAKDVVAGFYSAGISVKMITGDFSETASAIAGMVGISESQKVLTGDEVMAMPDKELEAQLHSVNVYARMFPDAKLRIVNTFKKMGEVVAMTGDGVNDGPALKSANIGVAMGKRGTEVARQAASLVLVNDDLMGMLDAISLGRKIYLNLKKAISYIVSIHIPIILSLAVPLVFGWEFVGIFSPIHIIFLELVMGPTCSIAFENEPAEPGIMKMPPRKLKDTFFSRKELVQNISQGLVISASVLIVYYLFMVTNRSETEVRTLVFTALVLSNIFLTLANRSFILSAFQTLFIPNRTLWWMLGITFGILLAALFVHPVQKLFQFSPVIFSDLLVCLLIVLPGVFWIEGLKFLRRKKQAISVKAAAS